AWCWTTRPSASAPTEPPHRSHDGIQLVEHIDEANGATVFALARRLGLEGMVRSDATCVTSTAAGACGSRRRTRTAGRHYEFGKIGSKRPLRSQRSTTSASTSSSRARKTILRRWSRFSVSRASAYSLSASALSSLDFHMAAYSH